MSGKKNDDKKSVVIVGGGAAGVNIARPLSGKLDASKYNIILIEPRPYRVLLPATLRMVVSDADNLTETALVPYHKLFYNNNGTVIQGAVQSIKQNAGENKGVVVLQNGDEVAYDVLVLSSGSIWEGPINFPDDAEEVKKFIQSSRTQFANAKHIVIAGGGAVGCELAGEIKDIWPKKDVTIVHGDNKLLNDTYPDKFRIPLAKRFEDRGVKILLGEFIDEFPETENYSSVTTRSGKTLDADLVVAARGPRPNTGFINSLGSDILTSRGYVKIKPTMQLSAYSNIFAAGDIIEWKEQKQAAKAGNHGALVTANILKYLTGGALKNYSTGPEMIIVTNGKHGGLAYLDILWGITLGSWFARLLKSKSLLVPMFRGHSGL